MNLLGIKSPEELDSIKVDTDYILEVESRINSLFDSVVKQSNEQSINSLCDGLNKEQQETLTNIINLLKENLEDDDSDETLNSYKYLHNFIQAMSSSKELKYMLGYVSKSAGFIPPLEYLFNEEEQFLFQKRGILQ